MGNALVPLVMYGWLPIVFYIFNRYPAQRAVVLSFVYAWMFLPLASLKVLPGIPAYTKISATCYGVLLVTAVYDSARFGKFKFHWLDIPVLAWSICPFITSVVNGLGPYDGVSSSFSQIVAWTFPYYLGRLYLGNLSGMRELAIGVFSGCLVYCPFCFFEMRAFMSLHELIFGFNNGRDFGQSLRYGGYRPAVFMEHGLMVGMWMMWGALVGIILWRTGALKQLWGLPVSVLVGIQTVMFILMRSTGAYLLIVMGLAIFYMAKFLRTTVLVWILSGTIIYYLYLGVTGTFPGAEIIAQMKQVFNPDRVQSVEFRFDNEEILGARARLTPTSTWFGWGGFGRNRVFDEYGKDISVTDSLWIIVFGINGALGLIAIFSILILPVLAFCVRYPPKWWFHPAVAPAASMAIGILMYAIDSVLNAMINPLFVLAAGGLVGVVINRPKAIGKPA